MFDRRGKAAAIGLAAVQRNKSEYGRRRRSLPSMVVKGVAARH
jgi:hypothetical protein